MNKDIKIMVELQRYWSTMLSAESMINKKKESMEFWKKEASDKKEHLDNISNLIKKLKNVIKEKDLYLRELGDKADKLEKRKSVISTEREMEALSKELSLINNDRNNLEEELIGLIDELGDDEKNLEKNDMEYLSMLEQFRQDKINIEKDIASQENIKNDNKIKFDNLITALERTLNLKFQKLLTSKNGIGIAEIKNEVCNACNFKIPSSLAMDAAKDDRITNCTNCGRFIYKIR